MDNLDVLKALVTAVKAATQELFPQIDTRDFLHSLIRPRVLAGCT